MKFLRNYDTLTAQPLLELLERLLNVWFVEALAELVWVDADREGPCSNLNVALYKAVVRNITLAL